MAKKGQTVQLQTEVSNDEEWEKLLQRDGLIIVDVYSDWCGPCLGMSANLKKLKLEIGGDSLQLAMAKCDNITQLERFRNKSEPTWMFISKGKMMNLMFGADAPKLRLLILDELKLEHAAAADESVREGKEITEFSEEEQVRYEAAENIARAAREKEEAKYAKELKERRTAECHQILENLSTFGVILILPNAREHYAEALSDLINEAGLIIHQTEKVQFTQEIIHELCLYAEENIFSEDTEEAMINNECLFLLVKPGRGEVIEDLHDVILHIVYGPLKQPPGTAESPYHKLCEYVEGEEGKKKEIMGIWTPFRPQVLAGVFRLFFHKLANDYLIPEPEPIPDHLAIVFDHKKRQDALQIMKQYPDEIMHYGFFMNDTTENAEAATLVAKSVRRLEKEVDKLTFSEKLIIQASKKKSECIFAFASLGPMYMSLNAEEGKKECQVYFPDDYADSLNEDDLAFEGLQADEIGDEENAEEEETEEEGEHDEETEGEMEDGTEEEGDPEEEEEEGDGEDMDDLFSVPP